MRLDLTLQALFRRGTLIAWIFFFVRPVHSKQPVITGTGKVETIDFYPDPPSLPEPYSPLIPLNTIRVWEAKAPEQDAGRLVQRPVRDVLQTSYFFDGLGRPIQTVVKRGSLQGAVSADWVSAECYDELGRTTYRYLPFPASDPNNNTINDGRFKTDPFQQQQRYAAKEFPDQDSYFQQTVYDATPMIEVLKELPPGKNWAGSNRGLSFRKEVNDHSDSVRVWKITEQSNAFGNYSSTGTHLPGTLLKHILTDENNKLVIEYKDQQGRLVLKKVQEGYLSTNAHQGWICTYFIYDALNRLRCVLQPEGVKAAMKAGWKLSDANLLAGQCFRFAYDGWGRAIMKQVPDGGTQLMVYDARGRMVLWQDASLRQGGVKRWKYFLYDRQNRLVANGLLNDDQSREQHAANAKNSIAWPDLNGKQYEELGLIHYDDYQGLPTGLPATMDNADAPFFAVPLNAGPDFVLPGMPSTQLRDQVTWSKTRIAGTKDWISTVKFYDENGLLLQEQTTNITGGKSIRSFQYNFEGQVVRTAFRQTIQGKTIRTITVYTKNSYDDLGRKIKIEKGLSLNAPMRTIASLEYDAAGKLKRKALGNLPDGAGPLETMEFDYHLRGWARAMNSRYLADTSSELNRFGYALKYENSQMVINGTTVHPTGKQFNGNLSAMFWKSTGDDQTRYYAFDYDGANRLSTANFDQWPKAPVDFTIDNLRYDDNGNILCMNRKAWLFTKSATIDSLTYTYFPGSNKLMKVQDAADTSLPDLGDFTVSDRYRLRKKASAMDYSYDANGNLQSDLNKDIARVEYDLCNLPVKIQLPGKGTIQYLRTASGEKLKRIVTDSVAELVLTTLYLEGAVYNSCKHFTASADDYEDSLQYILQEEGRIRVTATGNHFDYFIRDHLGNIRMVLTEQKQVDKYPAATLETGSAATEKQFFRQLDAGRVIKPSGYPEQPGNQYVSRLNGRTIPLGPSILLRVMAGDQFSIKVDNWYRSNGAGAAPVNMLPALSALLGSALGAVSGGKVMASPRIPVDAGAAIIGLLQQREQALNGAAPRSFLNFLLLDEQFYPVITNNGKNSGVVRVGPSGLLNTINVTERAITKNGYLFIFCSNETPDIDMYFDNLQVTHMRGPLLEENHFYPFGLQMQALCSKAAGSPDNRLLHAGRELQAGWFKGVAEPAWYDFGSRMYDVHTSRWTTVDGAAESYYGLSPYACTGNDPMNTKELDGRLFIFASGFMLNQWFGGSSSTVTETYRELIDKGTYATWTVPVTNEKQYAPDRDYYRALPRNNGEPFGYWEEVDVNYRKSFNDNNAWYINGSFTPQSQAQDRFSEGMAAGRLLIERLEAGSISLAKDETIKIVGHSQGAAYAAGIASELVKHSKYGSRIEFVDYLAPHQPGDFTHPSGVKGRQFSTVDDIVSSAAGWKGSFLNMFNGGSRLEQINGVQETMLRYYGRGGKGGHYVGTWLNDLISYWRSIGIPVYEQ